MTLTTSEYSLPVANIWEQDDQYIMDIELPGVSSDEISVNVESDFLVIEGKANKKEFDQEVYREFDIKNYRRKFRLNDCIDTESIKATYELGILHLSLQKKRPKQINVAIQ